MSYIEIFLLAFALSIDACVVSFSYGLCYENKKYGVLLGSFTGIFQGIMPCIGYFLTSFVREYIAPWSGLIIFTIFLFLGLKFIKESFEKHKKPNCISLYCLFLIGIATSIDAFSAGVSLSLSGNHILKPAILIGLVTYINAILGFYSGGKLKSMPSRPLEICAGIILICLGIKAII